MALMLLTWALEGVYVSVHARVCVWMGLQKKRECTHCEGAAPLSQSDGRDLALILCDRLTRAARAKFLPVRMRTLPHHGDPATAL